MIRGIAALLWPRAQGLYNGWDRADRAQRSAYALFGLLGVMFWVGVFVLVFWIVQSFYDVEVFGPILTRKLMELLLLALFGLLCFSNVVSGLSVFYLSEDLDLLLSLPIERPTFHMARLMDTMGQSSWMMVAFGVPVFLTYGLVYGAGPLYYALLFVVIPSFVLIPASLGVGVASILVTLFPARRIREGLVFVGILALVFLFVGLRLLRPERLADAQSFESLAAYVAALQAPVPLLAPPRWASDVVLAAVKSQPIPWMELGLLVTGAVAVTGMTRWLMVGTYDQGRARAQEAREARLAKAGWFDRLLAWVTTPLGHQAAAQVIKDTKTFIRDHGQWSQLFLLASVVVIALTSVAALPLDVFRGPWIGAFRNALAFLVLGLVGFVMAAVAARFQFVAVSAEGRAFWMIRSSPISGEDYLWGKMWLGLVPMIVVGEIMAVVSTWILGAGTFLSCLAAATALGLAFGISGLALGMGAVFADFKLDNAARAAAGPSGVLFMVVSLCLVGAVIALESIPVYVVLAAQVSGSSLSTLQWVQVVVPLLASAALCAWALIAPIRFGARRLWERGLP